MAAQILSGECTSKARVLGHAEDRSAVAINGAGPPTKTEASRSPIEGPLYRSFQCLGRRHRVLGAG